MTPDLAPAPIIGHGPALGRLRAAADDGRLPHALLITGPTAVGKTTVAMALADHVLGGAAWPGGLLAHPDLWLEDSDAETIAMARVAPRQNSSDLGVPLLTALSLRAYAGGARVAIIARAERLRDGVANALLKVIEEPPPGVHIVLCTASPETLPETIRSRCQVVTLAPVATDVIRDWLVARAGSAAPADLASVMAGGRPGRALRLATEPGQLALELDTLDDFLRVGGGDYTDTLSAAARLAPPNSAEGRERALLQMGVWTSFIRDVAAVAAGAPELIGWTGYAEAIAGWAAALPLGRVLAIEAEFLRAAEALTHNVTPRLCYEVLLVDTFINRQAPPVITVMPERPAGLGEATAAPQRKSRRR